MTLGQAEPMQAWHWDIRTGRLAMYEFPRPNGMSAGDRAEALDAWGFQLEFSAMPESYSGPTATVYSRFLPDGDQERDSKVMPFHYCIVIELGASYDLVFAADLPELVDALRYLAPLIKH
ncbi:MAG TPA: hypothetical protein VGP82_06505 [Ktedonobacterales bacterium]|nr:hypothetical protein [Ktedonobacterales bacterium]